MKKFVGAVVAVLSLTAIVGGHLYYDTKLASISEEAHNQNLMTTQFNASEPDKESEEQIDEEQDSNADENTEVGETVEEESLVDLDLLMPGFAEAVTDVRETGEELKIAIYASDVMLDIEGEGQLWPEVIDDRLSDLFQDISYEIAVYSAGEFNTVELIQSSDFERVVEEERHLVILESMLWNDNGQVNYEQSADYIDQIKTAFEQAGSEVITVLSPPAYQTVNYPVQIDYMSTYAEENDWLIADHWTYWPDMADESLLAYVDEESRYMTNEGHRVVAHSVLDVLGIDPS